MKDFAFTRSCLFLVSLLIMFTVAPYGIAAQSNILFFEAQGLMAYTDSHSGWQAYSHHPHDAMQKPSVGIDYLGRIRTPSKDLGYVSLQFRLAYDEDEPDKIQAQVYNAFVNGKTRWADVWIGHNKTAIGLNSYLDNHALLLADNTMSGLNFDRDWGVGIKHDGGNWNLNLSAGTGSGMPLYVGENYLLGSRLAWGDLSRSNATIGLSLAKGNVLKSMGYHVMHNNKKHPMLLGGMDIGWRYLDFDLKTDLLYGSYDDDPAYALVARSAYYPLPEDRLGIELQFQANELKSTKSTAYSAGLAYRINSDFTLRSTNVLQEPEGIQTIALQVYFYKGIVF